MKGPKAAAGMIKHAVKGHSYALVVGRIQQFTQGGVAPEQRVNLIMIVGVVAVVGGRGPASSQVCR